jgi:hypothetical protein
MNKYLLTIFFHPAKRALPYSYGGFADPLVPAIGGVRIMVALLTMD